MGEGIKKGFTPIKCSAGDCAIYMRNKCVVEVRVCCDCVQLCQGENNAEVIPCCSFPFSHDGEIYHSCAATTTDSTGWGCYQRGRVWATCPATASGKISCDISSVNVL